jgi:hypothetical protein
MGHASSILAEHLSPSHLQGQGQGGLQQLQGPASEAALQAPFRPDLQQAPDTPPLPLAGEPSLDSTTTGDNEILFFNQGAALPPKMPPRGVPAASPPPSSSSSSSSPRPPAPSSARPTALPPLAHGALAIAPPLRHVSVVGGPEERSPRAAPTPLQAPAHLQLLQAKPQGQAPAEQAPPWLQDLMVRRASQQQQLPQGGAQPAHRLQPLRTAAQDNRQAPSGAASPSNAERK